MIPRRLFWLLDLGVLFISFCLTYQLWPHLYEWFGSTPRLAGWLQVLRPKFPEATSLPQLREMVWIFAIAAPATVLFIALFNGHDPLLEQSRTRIALTAFGAPLLSAGILTFVAFTVQRSDVSRVFIYAFTILGGIGVGALRFAVRSYLVQRRNAGFYAKRVLLIGTPEVIVSLIANFQETVSPQQYRIEGFLTDVEPDAEAAQWLGNSGVRSLGSVDDAGNLLIHHPIHEVIAVQSASGSLWMRKVVEDCDALGVLLRIIPETLLFGRTRTLRNLYPLQFLHLPAVVLAPIHFDTDAILFKRFFDILISAILLLLLSPLFLLIAIIIKLTDPESDVFYRWNVVGRNGVRFTGYKFTTMDEDADERRKELLEKNEMSGPVFKIRNDPRVTPLGRFLRKYSLNELPQLWSVIKGDMSLVGPRPAFPHELERYDFWHKRKLSIRPGITCLWQVRGRNRISNFDDWVEMDLEYIDNWSLWLDFKILARTAWVVVAGTGS